MLNYNLRKLKKMKRQNKGQMQRKEKKFHIYAKYWSNYISNYSKCDLAQ